MVMVSPAKIGKFAHNHNIVNHSVLNLIDSEV